MWTRAPTSNTTPSRPSPGAHLDCSTDQVGAGRLLSYRMSCGHGVCGSDAMRINGTCALACQKLVKDYQCPEIVLEPLPFFKVLKTWWSTLSRFSMRCRRCAPTSIRPPRSRQGMATVARAAGEDRCGHPLHPMRVLHGILSRVLLQPEYLGPAALVWAYRYVFDSRDGQTDWRLADLDRPNGCGPASIISSARGCARSPSGH